MKTFFIVSLFIVLFIKNGFSQVSPLAWWSFENSTSMFTSSGETRGEISGNYKYMDGVSGRCIKFDEYTTFLRLKSEEVPNLNPKSFTIEAWIAPHSYPWNWCPIIAQESEEAGFFFGIDSDGKFGLHVFVDGQWHRCNTRPSLPGLEEQTIEQFLEPKPMGKADPVLPLLKWSHLMGVFDAKKGIVIYLNGKEEGRLEFTGEIALAHDNPLFIGRNEKKKFAAHMERPIANDKFYYSFDGLLDEIKIYNMALSASEVETAFQKEQPSVSQPFNYKKIPTGPKNPTKFGAYTTRLKYDEDWDNTRRIGDYSDIVVTFDEFPFKLIYWNGTSYYPTWWTENDIGIAHEGPETWKPNTGYCYEAMMDRQCRYSRVQIIENNPARVKILWRFNLADMNYLPTNIDTITGWSDWSEDIYTIYPDGVASREVTLWSNTIPGNHSFEQEDYIIQPGMLPEDILEKEAITLANIDGQEFTYSWEKNPPTAIGEKVLPEEVVKSTVNDARVYFGSKEGVKDPVIQYYNLKAESKPFMIVREGAAKFGLICPLNDWPWSLYRWNHFPVGQIPSDGRQVFGIDGRPLSSCVTQTAFDKNHPANKITDRSLTMYFMFGMTMDKKAGELAPLARSWNNPAKIVIQGNDVIDHGYSIAERCYQLENKSGKQNLKISLVLQASEESPIVNPAFVIKNYEVKDLRLKINGKSVQQGKDFRVGNRENIDGTTDAIIWIKETSFNPVHIEFI